MKLRYWRIKLALAAFSCIVSLYVFFQVFNHGCSNSENIKRINELCALYASKTISGDLCEALCSDYTIRPVRCIGHKEGKRVITAMWGNMEIILKAKSFNTSLYQGEWEVGDASTLDVFRKSVLMLLRDLHGIHVPHDKQEGILDLMWSNRFNWKESDREGLQVAMRSLWSLLRQDECPRMQYHQGNSHIPTIHGTCGSLYAVRSIPPSQVFDLNPLNSYKNVWSDRVRVALAFLDLIEDLETQFPEPLQVCDVQEGNFGFFKDTNDPSSSSQQSIASLIDMDMVNSMHYLSVSGEEECDNDEQCDFFECKSQCVKRKCTGGRVNNNLQSFCERIFMSNWSKGYSGLLANPPESIRSDLEAVLYSCVHPDLPDGSLRTPKDTLSKIREVLMKSYDV